MTLPGLVVVMPVHNEVAHLERTLKRLRTALEASPWAGATVVVVDDGSSDGSGLLLDRLAPALGLRVLHQPNSGRLAAREAGLRAAEAELALLVDARVAVDEGALAHVAEEIEADPTAVLWNGDVTVETAGNPYAGFWAALTALGWRRYFANRRRTSYGLQEFDVFPKGTTMFLAPRLWLLEASQDLDSHFDDPRLASDDTQLLRRLVARARIHLSPGFSCRYTGRSALVPFIGHAWFRGTTFVDSYLGRGGPLGRAVAVAAFATPPVAAVALRHPRFALGAWAATSAALYTGARSSGARPEEARALVALAPVFAAPFGAGVVRGLALAAGARLRG